MSEEEKSEDSSVAPFTAFADVSFCEVVPELLIGMAVVGVVVSFMLIGDKKPPMRI